MESEREIRREKDVEKKRSENMSEEREKNGSTQNRTGVLRTRISYAAPTPWNHYNNLEREKELKEKKEQRRKEIEKRKETEKREIEKGPDRN